MSRSLAIIFGSMSWGAATMSESTHSTASSVSKALQGVVNRKHSLEHTPHTWERHAEGTHYYIIVMTFDNKPLPTRLSSSEEQTPEQQLVA